MVISTAFRLCSGSQQSLTLLAYIAAVCGAEFVHFMRYWSWMYLSPCPDHDAEAARPPSYWHWYQHVHVSRFKSRFLDPGWGVACDWFGYIWILWYLEQQNETL